MNLGVWAAIAALYFFSQPDHQPGASPRGVAPMGGPPPEPAPKRYPPPAVGSSPSDYSAWFGAASKNADKIGDAVVSVYDHIVGSEGGSSGPSPVQTDTGWQAS